MVDSAGLEGTLKTQPLMTPWLRYSSDSQGLLLPSSTGVTNVLAVYRGMVTAPICQLRGQSSRLHLLKDLRSPNLTLSSSKPTVTPSANPSPLYPHKHPASCRCPDGDRAMLDTVIPRSTLLLLPADSPAQTQLSISEDDLWAICINCCFLLSLSTNTTRYTQLPHNQWCSQGEQ